MAVYGSVCGVPFSWSRVHWRCVCARGGITFDPLGSDGPGERLVEESGDIREYLSFRASMSRQS